MAASASLLISEAHLCGPIISWFFSSITATVIGAVFFRTTLIFFFTASSSTQKQIRMPPWLWSSWIPLIGSGAGLGHNSVRFLEQSHQKHGPVFRIKAGNDRIVFVEDYHFAASMARKPQVFSFNALFIEWAEHVFQVKLKFEQMKLMHNWANQYFSHGRSLERVIDRFSNNFRVS